MEAWHGKKDGSRFWANVITLAVREENGHLQRFDRVIRDFTGSYKNDAGLRSASGSLPVQSAGSTVVGIISGELDQIPEANQVFLDLVGYTREDLKSGKNAVSGDDAHRIRC